MTAPALTVSVVIPVYNAEAYLEEAVASAVSERDRGVHEILLIEDASSDNSLAVCRGLRETHPRLVRIVRHPGGENRGAGASRNLGIASATGDLVCFLDADDYWLPGRLDHAVRMLSTQLDLDGVYDRGAVSFESDRDRERFGDASKTNGRIQSDTTPEDLFYDHVHGLTGLWHTNGIVVRRSAFAHCGMFNEALRLNQDFEFWYRMAAVLRLARAPSRDPVAVQRRHPGNRWFSGEGRTPAGCERQARLWDGLYEWFWNHPVSEKNRKAFLWVYCIRLGQHRRWSRAWRVAGEQRSPWMMFTALRGFLPGPRTLWRPLTRRPRNA